MDYENGWSPEEAESQNEIAYPLNNTWYTARFAQLFHSTRTNGVFSSDDDLRLRPGGGLRVNLTTGLAWMRIDRFRGIAYAQTNEEGLFFDVPPPHGNLLRLDRMAIRFDYILNDVFAVYKIGTPGMPAPALQRDTEAYEIHVHEVVVAAGTLEIRQDMIRDLRLNEALCGIMRDGVTGIPTQQLHEAWQSFYSRIVSEATREYDEYVTELREAFAAFAMWFESYREEAQNDFENWVALIKEILDEEIAGQLLLMIQELQADKPTVIIGTVTHSAGSFPVCNLYRTNNAAGMSPAGTTPAGGDNLVSIPAEFEIDGHETVSVKTLAEFAGFTTISKINDRMFAFLPTGGSRSLLLTLN